MNERESRREALEDMIRISEEAGLYEEQARIFAEAKASTNLDGQTIDILGTSSVDWQATAMRYMELNSQKNEAISRVRELHEKVPCTEDGECCHICDYCGYLYPCQTIKALDGEQS